MGTAGFSSAGLGSPGQELVEDGSERSEVGGKAARRVFRGPERRIAKDDAGTSKGPRKEGPFRHEQVRRFQVAVRKPSAVEDAQRFGCRAHPRDEFRWSLALKRQQDVRAFDVRPEEVRSLGFRVDSKGHGKGQRRMAQGREIPNVLPQLPVGETGAPPRKPAKHPTRAPRCAVFGEKTCSPRLPAQRALDSNASRPMTWFHEGLSEFL